MGMQRPLSPQTKLWMLVAGVGVAAAAVWLGPVRSLRVTQTPIHIAWWVLAPLFFLSIRSGVRWYMKQTSLNSGIAEVPLILALFFSSPIDLLVGYVIGQVAVEATRSVRVPWRMAFAMALHLLVLPLAYLLFRTVLQNPSAVDDKAWLAVVAAIAVFNLRLVVGSVAMRISGTRLGFRVLLGTFAYSLGSASVGMLAAVLVAANPTSVIWLLPIIAALGISSRVHGAEHSQRQALEILAGAGADLDAAMDFDATLHIVVARLRRVFRAQVAQITLCAARPGFKAYRTTVRLEGPDEVVSPGLADLSPAFLDNHRQGLIVAGSTTESEGRAVLTRHGIPEALVVPIVIRNRAVGYILIGGHTDEKDGNYRQATLTVVQSLASQTAQLLQNKQLEKALADLSERETELTYRAFHDPLTGLPSRALFMDRLMQVHERLARSGGRVTIARIDLDDLAAINERYGRAAGDFVLVTVAQAIRGVLREGETAARFGGDDFAMVLEDSAATDDPESTGRRILTAISAPKFYGSDLLTVTASVGLTVIDPSDRRSVGDFVEEAEKALLDAKARGRDRCVGYGLGLEIDGVAVAAVIPAIPRG